jgi:hypothetical protein
MYFIIMLCYHAMSERPVDSDNVTARVLKHNEKFKVPIVEGVGIMAEEKHKPSSLISHNSSLALYLYSHTCV